MNHVDDNNQVYIIRKDLKQELTITRGISVSHIPAPIYTSLYATEPPLFLSPNKTSWNFHATLTVRRHLMCQNPSWKQPDAPGGIHSALRSRHDRRIQEIYRSRKLSIDALSFSAEPLMLHVVDGRQLREHALLCPLRCLHRQGVHEQLGLRE